MSGRPSKQGSRLAAIAPGVLCYRLDRLRDVLHPFPGSGDGSNPSGSGGTFPRNIVNRSPSFRKRLRSFAPFQPTFDLLPDGTLAVDQRATGIARVEVGMRARRSNVALPGVLGGTCGNGAD